MDSLLLLPILAICCFAPGFFLVRKLRLTLDETICASIAASLILIYAFSGIVYLTHIDWRCCWLFTLAAIALAAISWRDLRKLWSRSHARQQFVAFGFLILLGLLILSLIQHYSGAAWAGDWKEHYDRSLFFLLHQPHDTVFITLYVLPARPPMMHLIAAGFLAQMGQGFDHFQLISLFLNALVFFPCVLLAGMLVKNGNRRVWLIAAFLAASPVFMQNITWTWNKLLAAFFVILSIAFYLRGWRKQSPRHIIAAAASMAAGILVHYSAGPYALFLALHYPFIFLKRRNKTEEVLGCILAPIGLLATWFIWSISTYGINATFGSNTASAGTAALSAQQNLHKIASNFISTLIPFPFHTSFRDFYDLCAQPNQFGSVRDYSFLLLQQNLPLSVGLLGWAFVLQLMTKLLRNAEAPLRWFWIGFTIFTLSAGIAVVGTQESFGIAHVCLQPLTVIGVVLLAAGFANLRPWMRAIIAFSTVLQVAVGILLHIRIEMLDIHAVVVGRLQVVPLSSGLPSFEGIINALRKSDSSLQYISGHFTGAEPFLFVFLIAVMAGVTYFLGRVALNRRTGIAAMILLILSACAVTLDRQAGYVVADSLPGLTSDESQLIAVQANPESFAAHYELAVARYYLGRLDDARRALFDAALLNPDDDRIHSLLGMFIYGYAVNSVDDDYDMKVIYRGQQLAGAPNHVQYGIRLYTRGFHPTALTVLTNAAKQYPSDPLPHASVAPLLLLAGRADDAILEAETALRLAPHSEEQANHLRAILTSLKFDQNRIDRRVQEIQFGAR